MTYSQGDLIQIVDEAHPWFPCVLTIDGSSSRPGRLMAYCFVPESNDGSKKPGRAYIFLKEEQVELVGKAAFVPADSQEEE